MEKTRYCVKCNNLFKVNDLAPDSFRCPYCGHVITPFEDHSFQQFGILGAKFRVGCLIIGWIAIIGVVIYIFKHICDPVIHIGEESLAARDAEGHFFGREAVFRGGYPHRFSPVVP